MIWAVKPKAQRFEGLGWYSGFRMPLGLESSGTINEHGKDVVRPVNKALTVCGEEQPMVVHCLPCSENDIMLRKPTREG